jgi:hypothetical protein
VFGGGGVYGRRPSGYGYRSGDDPAGEELPPLAEMEIEVDKLPTPAQPGAPIEIEFFDGADAGGNTAQSDDTSSTWISLLVLACALLGLVYVVFCL